MTFDELLRKESFSEKEVEEFREACYSVASPHFLIELLDSVEHRFCDPVIKTQAIQAVWYLLLQLKESYEWFQKHEFDRILFDYVDELKCSKENGEDRYSIRFKCLEHSIDPRTFERLKQSFLNDEWSASKVKEE